MELLNLKLLEVCSRCGACYHICPSCLNLPDYDPRAVIKDILAGRHEKWLNHKSIWQCLECHYCVEICFQHYGFENAMTAMRTLSAKKGITPVQVKRGWDMFIKTSRLGEPMAPARKKLNLPEAAKSGIEDFKKMVKVYQERKNSESRSQKPK
ncbi:MAG: 4Fe-4S dicluster domain-containing protein [Deltaproteobacteria bacterium]